MLKAYPKVQIVTFLLKNIVFVSRSLINKIFIAAPVHSNPISLSSFRALSNVAPWKLGSLMSGENKKY